MIIKFGGDGMSELTKLYLPFRNYVPSEQEPINMHEKKGTTFLFPVSFLKIPSQGV